MKRVAVLAIFALTAAVWFFHTPSRQPTFTTTATPVAVTPVPTPQSAPQPQIQPITTSAPAAAMKSSSLPQVATSTAAERMPVIKNNPNAAKVLSLEDHMADPATIGQTFEAVYEALCVRGPTNHARPHCNGTEPDIGVADILLAMHFTCEEEEICKNVVSQLYLEADRRGLISIAMRNANEEQNVEMATFAAINISIADISGTICAEQGLVVGNIFNRADLSSHLLCVPPGSPYAAIRNIASL